MTRITTSILFFAVLAALGCGQKTAETPAASHSIVGDAARGKQLITRHGCNVCHAGSGVQGFEGTLGPSLAGVASRPTISNGRVQNTPENLARFIREPGALNPQSAMPPVAITEEEARDITAFLLTLD